MEPSDPFADLADGFHAAALSPDLWPAALQHLSDRVGGAGVFLALENYEGRIKPLGSTRVHPGAAGTYRQNPAGGGVNEARRAVELASLGAIVPRRAVFDDAVWERSEVYQRLLRPWDLYHVAAAPIVRHATDFVMLTAMRPRRAEDFSGVEQAFLSGALRHLGHALRVMFHLRTLEARAEAAEAALDRLPVGVALLDAGGRVLHMNSALQMLVADADGLAVGCGGVFVAARQADTEALARAVASVTSSTPRAGMLRGGALTVMRPSGSRPLSVLVSPLEPAAASACSALLLVRRGVVLVLVSDPERRHETPAALLARLHGLSPTQAELVVHLLAGLDLKDAAQALGVTINTAKTLLSRAFLVTGTSKQSELLSVILRGPAGFVDSSSLG